MRNIPDAVSVAPDIHKVILENDRVRVLDVVVPHGAHAALHSHPDNVVIVTQGGLLKMTYDTGVTKEVEFKTGAITYAPANAHEMLNIDTKEVRVIQVELK